MRRSRCRAGVAAAGTALLAASACGIVVEDDWGPPAGYARVEGTIGSSFDQKIPGLGVLLHCASPIGAFAGEDVTGSDGSYATSLTMLPEGLIRLEDRPPTRVLCNVVAGRGLVEAAVDVPFARRRSEAEPVVAHLVVGKGRVAPCESATRAEPAPLLEPTDPSAVVPGEYVVRYEDGVFEVARLARELVAEAGGELLHVYEEAIEGFAARLDDDGVASVRGSACVRYVAPNGSAATQG